MLTRVPKETNGNIQSVKNYIRTDRERKEGISNLIRFDSVPFPIGKTKRKLPTKIRAHSDMITTRRRFVV